MKNSFRLNSMKIIQIILAAMAFPLSFLIMLPIELPLWKEYRRQQYDVPCYLKFFWDRCLFFKEPSFKKHSNE